MFSPIFYYHLKRSFEYFKTEKTAKMITLALFVIVFAGLAGGIYYFFLKGFGHIRSYPVFAQALTLYSYEAYLLFTLFLIAISAFISSISTLFKSGENDWIIVSPAYKKFLSLSFLKTFVASSWPLLVITIPSLFAIRSIYGLSLFSITASMFSMILLILLTTSVVYLLILAGSRALDLLSGLLSKNLLNFKNLTLTTILLFLLMAGAVWYTGFNVDLISLFKAQDLDRQTISPEIISENFKFSPAHPVAASIFAFQNNDMTKGYLLIFFLMVITALTAGMARSASGWFLPARQKMQEGGFTAKPKRKGPRKKERPAFFLNSPEGALFKKEFLVSSRNMRDLMWFGFFVFIWLLQTGVNLILSKNMADYDITLGSFPVIIQVLQFLTAVFFISAFTLRFVFPSFSMEKNTAWITDSAPIKKQRIFWAKLFFYLPVLILLGITIGYSNLLIMDLSSTHTLSTFILFLASILFVVVLGLSLGAMFPNKEIGDPAALSTSMPGIGFTLGALGHGILGALFLFQLLNNSGYLNFSIFITITVIISVLLLYMAPLSFSKNSLTKKTIS